MQSKEIDYGYWGCDSNCTGCAACEDKYYSRLEYEYETLQESLQQAGIELDHIN